MKPAFDAIFARLRKILEPHAARLRVSVDEPDHYCLEAASSPQLPKAYPAAWLNSGHVKVPMMSSGCN